MPSWASVALIIALAGVAIAGTAILAGLIWALGDRSFWVETGDED